MTELKFRAYNTSRKEVEVITDLYWFEENYVHNNGDECWIISMYTGFKDIHGKEIYEGDFVKSKIFEGDDDKQSITGQVKFIKGAFGIQCYEKDAVVEFIYICEFGSLELLDNP